MPERNVNNFKGCSVVGGGVGKHRLCYPVTELKRMGEVGEFRLPDESASEAIKFITDRSFSYGELLATGEPWARSVCHL